jgi:Tfp pilus assembly protein PilX
MNLKYPPHHPGRQQGTTLLVALVMLIIMTLLVVTSFKIGETNLKIVANAQDKQRTSNTADRLLNERLHAISSGIAADPCDLSALTAADGTLTETIDNVAVTFSRTLIRAQCVPNIDVRDPWLSAVNALTAALSTREAACATPDSDACLAAQVAYATAEENRRKADLRAKECMRKPQTNPSLVGTDPEVEAAEAEAAAAAADDEAEDESGSGLPTLSDEEAAANSYCVDVVMEIRADAIDTLTSARASISRGIALHCSNHDIPEC